MLAVFDFLVFATSLFAWSRARRGMPRDLLASLGFLLIAGAALIGTFRYAYFEEWAPLHKFASTCASVYGVPAIAAGFFLTAEETVRPSRFAALAAGILLPAVYFFHSPLYALLIGIVAQVVWIVGAIRFQKVYRKVPVLIVASVICISIAGLVFAGGGSTMGIRNENWFHGLLALGITQQALVFGYLRKPGFV